MIFFKHSGYVFLTLARLTGSPQARYKHRAGLTEDAACTVGFFSIASCNEARPK